MTRDVNDFPEGRNACFVGRPPPTNDETVWIDEDYVFDLMLAICDLLYEDGCRGSSYLVERALDLFLYETGRIPSPNRKAECAAFSVPAQERREVAVVHRPQSTSANTIFQSKRIHATESTASPRRQRNPAYAWNETLTDQRIDHRHVEPSAIGFDRASLFAQATRAQLPNGGQMCSGSTRNFFSSDSSVYSIHIVAVDPKVTALSRRLRSAMERAKGRVR